MYRAHPPVFPGKKSYQNGSEKGKVLHCKDSLSQPLLLEPSPGYTWTEVSSSSEHVLKPRGPRDTTTQTGAQTAQAPDTDKVQWVTEAREVHIRSSLTCSAASRPAQGALSDATTMRHTTSCTGTASRHALTQHLRGPVADWVRLCCYR